MTMGYLILVIGLIFGYYVLINVPMYVCVEEYGLAPNLTVCYEYSSEISELFIVGLVITLIIIVIGFISLFFEITKPKISSKLHN